MNEMEALMMTKVDVVRAEMVKAMKAGDKERKNALSMLLSALKNATIDKRSDLTEEEADQADTGDTGYNTVRPHRYY